MMVSEDDGIEDDEIEESFENWWNNLDDIERGNYNMIMKEYEESENDDE